MNGKWLAVVMVVGTAAAADFYLTGGWRDSVVFAAGVAAGTAMVLLSRRLAPGGRTAALPTETRRQPPQPAPSESSPPPSGQRVYAAAMAMELTSWRDVSHRLASALERDEFILFSQPIVPLRAGLPAIAFQEILVRLQEEEDNLMPPGAFLPLAEEHGLMADLDQWVIRRLLNWAGADGARCAGVYSINVAGASMGDPAFTEYVSAAMHARRQSGPVVCFEFGEHDAMLDLAATSAFMNQLKAEGCRFALSGFTAEPMSFKLMQRLRVDYLKIDGGIVVNMERNPVDAARVAAITRAAHAVGVLTIAECVESDVVMDALRRMGVDYGQGFAIARPARLEQALVRSAA